MYKLNEAKETLLKTLKEPESRALSIIVTNALNKYREGEKREQEFKNEASILLTEKIKTRRGQITYLRDISILGTVGLAILSFIITSTNGFLDFSYENDKGAIEYSKDALSNDSTIKAKNYDSLYLKDANYKKKIVTITQQLLKKKKKREILYINFLDFLFWEWVEFGLHKLKHG